MIEAVHAATRAAGTTLFVCPTGWSSKVYELSGAAAAVWASFADSTTLDEIADHCGVDIDDEFLVAALGQLADSHLIRQTKRS